MTFPKREQLKSCFACGAYVRAKNRQHLSTERPGRQLISTTRGV